MSTSLPKICDTFQVLIPWLGSCRFECIRCDALPYWMRYIWYRLLRLRSRFILLKVCRCRFKYRRNISILLNHSFATSPIGSCTGSIIRAGTPNPLGLRPNNTLSLGLTLWWWRLRSLLAGLAHPDLLFLLLLQNLSDIPVEHRRLVLDLLLMLVWVALHFKLIKFQN